MAKESLNSNKKEPMVHCLFDKMVDVVLLKKHPKNANRHGQDQIERLAKIIQYQGWRYPIKVSNRSGFITSGHGRLLAALRLGLNEVPVNYQDYESDAMELADVHADNAIASWAELDLSSINSQIDLLGPDFDIELLGLKNFAIDPNDLDGFNPSDSTEEDKTHKTCPNCGVNL